MNVFHFYSVQAEETWNIGDLEKLQASNFTKDENAGPLNNVMQYGWPEHYKQKVSDSISKGIVLIRNLDDVMSMSLYKCVKHNICRTEVVLDAINRKLKMARGEDLLLLLKCTEHFTDLPDNIISTIEPLIDSKDYVVSIHACASLSRIERFQDKCELALQSHLDSKDAGVLWRTIHCMSESRISRKKAQVVIERFLVYSDIRVKIACVRLASSCSIKVEDETDLIRSSLLHTDMPMPLGYVFPSNSGPSHRKYAIDVISQLTTNDRALLKILVQLLMDASHSDELDTELQGVGIAALSIIPKFNPVEQVEYDEIFKAASNIRNTSRLPAKYINTFLANIKVKM